MTAIECFANIQIENDFITKILTKSKNSAAVLSSFWNEEKAPKN
jgi:hypothetical protein